MTEMREKRIGCIGSGLLAGAVFQALKQEYEVLAVNAEDLIYQAPSCSLMLYCDDQWHFQRQQEMNQRCLTLGIPWLRVYCEFGTGIIGPCVFPAEPGCMMCAEIRRLAVVMGATDFLSLRRFSDESKQRRTQPWLTSNSLAILTQLVIQEIRACLEQSGQAKTRNALLHLELDTLQCRRHCFLPEPECPACGRLPQDTAEAAIITLQPCPKLGPYTYRIRSLSDHSRQLLETYVDPFMGPISMLVKNPSLSMAMVTAGIGISDGERHSQLTGIGRTLNYAESKLAAIAEALERYGGQRPKGKRTTVQASYRELCTQALDPTTLGLHTAEQYALPDYRYVPFDPDLTCRWVWGYSFQRQQPILIPEHVAYYGLPRFGKDEMNPAFVYEISNGCALGSCLEEAIFYGILEVAERDAFLMTWYAQLGLPRLDAQSATDPTVGLLIEHLEHTTGYTLSLFNSTLDHGVPCCWVMAVDEQDRESMPKALCSAGSHPHPEHAVINALLELTPMLKRQAPWSEKERARALAMLADPMLVKEMEDHSFLYSLPEAFERLRFLFSSAQQLTFYEAFRSFYDQPASLDLCEDLQALIDHYLKQGIDIIVVDQTSQEHTYQGFHCVKVLMPGMLPMTFGHRYRRVSGFQRLAQVPYQLGYRSHPLAEHEINPHPHPFP
jgi:ribosomal protein S12 methylthiotransferase accessory factor